MNEVQTGTAGERSVSRAVVETIAEAEGIDPLKLSPPLYEVVDPDALDRIFAATPTAGRMEGRIAFVYKGYDVTVSGDGYVSIEPRE